MNRWIRRALCVLAALVVLLPVLLPRAALARAGGGGNYSGGGHGGGGGFGGGGGGGGGGALVFFLIQLLFQNPCIGIPVLVIVITFFIYSARKNSGADRFPTAPQANRAWEQQTVASNLQNLAGNDPSFDADAFLQRVRVAFMKIQTAWCSQDLAGVRPFISDGVHERFSLQFAEQRDLGYRDQMEQIAIDSATIAETVSHGLFDELSVRIVARAVDYRVELVDGKRLSGSTSVEPFVEVWSFLRRRGVTTNVTGRGLIEGNCPNCGAPIELNQSANCTNCKALLRSGNYDWVLCEITQESEWRPYERQSVPGMEELRQRDPEFNLNALEDRASVMFWRKASADRLGKIEPLTKIALPQFCQAYVQNFQPAPDGHRHFVGECGVGSVNLRGILSQASGDQALVEVRWSGKRFFVSTDGRLHNTGEEAVLRTLLVLFRQSGVKTDAGKSISSAHCPQCGAPESGGLSSACEFCGTILNDGARDWVVMDMLHFSDAKAQAFLRQLG